MATQRRIKPSQRYILAGAFISVLFTSFIQTTNVFFLLLIALGYGLQTMGMDVQVPSQRVILAVFTICSILQGGLAGWFVYRFSRRGTAAADKTGGAAGR